MFCFFIYFFLGTLYRTKRLPVTYQFFVLKVTFSLFYLITLLPDKIYGNSESQLLLQRTIRIIIVCKTQREASLEFFKTSYSL